VKWKKIKKDFVAAVKPKSEENVLKQIAMMVTYKIPKYASFVAGFYYGWKSTLKL